MLFLEQPVEKLMKTTMESIKSMIDVNTVVGDAIETSDGSIILPISRVSFAFVSGGGEFNQPKTKEDEKDKEKNSEKNNEAKQPFAGGSGACVSVQPIGFLVTSEDQIKMMPVHYGTAVERLIDMMPGLVDNIEGLFAKKTEETNKESMS